MKLYFTLFILCMCLSCSKTNTQNNNVPPQNGLNSQLSGNWKVVKYVAYNFDSTNGRTYIPNDTIYPVNSESWNFSADSIYIDTWKLLHTIRQPIHIVLQIHKQKNSQVPILI